MFTVLYVCACFSLLLTLSHFLGGGGGGGGGGSLWEHPRTKHCLRIPALDSIPTLATSHLPAPQ